MIFRTCKDKNNPYVTINKIFLEDMNLSLKAKGLLAFCMSKPDGWKFNIRHLVTVLKEGKDALYSTFEELMKCGYCRWVQPRNKKSGQFSKGHYMLSEVPLKEFLPQTGFPDTAESDAAYKDIYNIYNQVSNEESKESEEIPQLNPMMPSVGFITPLPSPSPRKKVVTKVILSDSLSELPFGRVALSFFNRLKELNPKVKEPNLQKWAKEFDLLAKEGNSEEEIEKVISYVLSTHNKPSSNGFCWANVIQSPTSLRKQFARLWAEMAQVASKSKNSSQDKQNQTEEEFERQLVHRRDFLKLAQRKNLWSRGLRYEDKIEYVEFRANERGETSKIYYKDANFVDRITHELRKREMI